MKDLGLARLSVLLEISATLDHGCKNALQERFARMLIYETRFQCFSGFFGIGTLFFGKDLYILYMPTEASTRPGP